MWNLWYGLLWALNALRVELCESWALIYRAYLLVGCVPFVSSLVYIIVKRLFEIWVFFTIWCDDTARRLRPISIHFIGRINLTWDFFTLLVEDRFRFWSFETNCLVWQSEKRFFIRMTSNSQGCRIHFEFKYIQ